MVISSSYRLPSLRRLTSSPRHILPPRMVLHISSYSARELRPDLRIRVLRSNYFRASVAGQLLERRVNPDDRSGLVGDHNSVSRRLKCSGLQLNETGTRPVGRKEIDIALILHLLNCSTKNTLGRGVDATYAGPNCQQPEREKQGSNDKLAYLADMLGDLKPLPSPNRALRVDGGSFSRFPAEGAESGGLIGRALDGDCKLPAGGTRMGHLRFSFG